MNNLTKTMMQYILILAMPIALSACAKENVSAPVITEASSSCTELLSEIDKQALSNEHKPLDDYFKSRIMLTNKECPKSFQRDFSIAQLLATSDEYDTAIVILSKIDSDNPELELNKLDLLFWLYSAKLNVVNSAKIVNEAISKYPENPKARLILSVNKCLIGSCKDELNNLINLDIKLKNIQALPYLAQAYLENEDYLLAAETFDKAISISGISVLSDKSMYAAVISNLNLQRDEKAKSIYIEYTQARPNVNTAYVHDAKVALDSLGLLDNKE